MKALVFLNGEPYKGEIDLKSSYVIACDAGYAYCKDRGIIPDKIIGDFDSLGYIPKDSTCYPVKKNFTDGEAAVDVLKEMNTCFEEVVFYNFGGGREDHFLGNISVLIKASKYFNAVAKTAFCDIYFVKDELRLKNLKKNTISIVPVTSSAHILDSRGLYYDASGKTIKKGQTLGISNVATKEEVYIRLKSGKILVFVVR